MKENIKTQFKIVFTILLVSYFGLISFIVLNVDLLVRASQTALLTVQINAGSLVTDIRDESRISINTPTFPMSTVGFSFTCLTGVEATTGNLGSNLQRIYIDNPGAATNGWTLTLAATDGQTAVWANTGNTEFYDFNDPGSAGCSDSADIDTYAGQLTVDPTTGTLTEDCISCTSSNISLGSQVGFEEGIVDSITLLNASPSSDNVGRWYLTGVNLSQTIPAEQVPDNYSLNLTLTVTAS